MSRVLRYLEVLLTWRRLIVANTLGLTLLAVALSFILPYRYTATARLLPPPQDDMFGVTSLLGGGVAGGLGRLSSGMFGQPTPSDLMVGVLDARTISVRVVERCSIIEHYGIRSGSVEEAIRQLGSMTTMTTGDEGIVSISVDGKTPELAARVANAYVEELDSFLRTSNISRGRNTRVFIEGRLQEVQRSLTVAKESLAVYQERHRMMSVEDETRAAIDAYAKLKSELVLKEAELGMVDGRWAPDNPYVAGLRHEIGAFRSQLNRIEEGKPIDGFGAGFAVSFGDLPRATAEFLTRYRDLRILEESYALLYQQYEYAKILEARDTPTTTVLDYAVPPERRSFPKRTRLVLLVFLFGLAMSVAFALVMEYFRHIASERAEEYQLWHSMLDQLKSVGRGLRLRSSRRSN